MHRTQGWVDVKRQADTQRVVMFKRLLGGPGEGRTLVDLGAGPCIFARVARDRGYKVTAVDGRTDMLPEDMNDIEFIKADVREFDPSGYDTVLNLGLLYHLPLAAQEKLLSACVGSRVILETQVHTPGVVPPAAEPWGHDTITVQRPRDGGDFAPVEKRRAFDRSPGDRPVYEGLLFRETRGERFENWRASIGNETSFWHTERSLLRMIERSGYATARVVEPPIYSTYGTRKFYVLNGPRDLEQAHLSG